MAQEQRIENHLAQGEGVAPAPFSMAYMTIQDGTDVDFRFLGNVVDTKKISRKNHGLMHRHNYYEVVFILEGEFTQRMENGNFHYREGDVVFLNRNVRHGEGYDHNCVLVFLNFSPEFMEGLFLSPANQIRPGVSQYKRGPIFQFVEENSGTEENHFRREYLDFFSTKGKIPVANLLDQIANELTAASTGYAFRIQALLLQFFEMLENSHLYLLSHIRVDASPEEFLYARVMRYLEAHHGRASREELGRYFHYNDDYLNQVVKRFSGMTLSQLGKKVYLQEAKKLLQDTNLGISEIIMRLGFVNRTYFYRIFLEDTGVTPKEYRKTHQKNGQFSSES